MHVACPACCRLISMACPASPRALRMQGCASTPAQQRSRCRLSSGRAPASRETVRGEGLRSEPAHTRPRLGAVTWTQQGSRVLPAACTLWALLAKTRRSRRPCQPQLPRNSEVTRFPRRRQAAAPQRRRWPGLRQANTGGTRIPLSPVQLQPCWPEPCASVSAEKAPAVHVKGLCT